LQNGGKATSADANPDVDVRDVIINPDVVGDAMTSKS
jgi:hypothetical protein